MQPEGRQGKPQCAMEGAFAVAVYGLIRLRGIFLASLNHGTHKICIPCLPSGGSSLKKIPPLLLLRHKGNHCADSSKENA